MNPEKNFYNMHPELLLEWDYSKNKKQPSEVRVTSTEKTYWKCHVCGHEWSTQALHRHYGTGCPKCGRIMAVQGKNDLETCYPEIAKDWDYENNEKRPSEIVAHSAYIANWKCERGHRWQMRVYIRVKRNSPCPYCSGKRAIPGETSLLQLYPELCEELFEPIEVIDPDKVKPTIKRIVHWKCEKGHIWKASIRHRAIDKSGCPYCARRRPIIGENDLGTLYPELLEEWDWEKNIFLPTEVGCSSTRGVHWKCKRRGHEWVTSVAHRTIRKSGCPYCAGQKAIPGENDLETMCPEILKDFDYEHNSLLPREIHWGSYKRISWVCSKCGHKWRIEVGRRTRKGMGCPKCSKG